MSFVSIQFLLFLFGVFVLYYIIPKKFQWVLLLVCSYGFYLYGGVKPVVFILLTTITTYFAAKWMDRMEQQYKGYIAEHKAKMEKEEKKKLKALNKMKKKRVLVSVLLLNFGVLLLLKYYNFLAGNISDVFTFFELFDITYMVYVNK